MVRKVSREGAKPQRKQDMHSSNTTLRLYVFAETNHCRVNEQRSNRFAILVACATFFLIIAGALVTSNDAGLATPDWPLSGGLFLPRVVGNLFYEHGHRMIATTVGLLTIGLCIYVRLKEKDTGSGGSRCLH